MSALHLENLCNLFLNPCLRKLLIQYDVKNRSVYIDTIYYFSEIKMSMQAELQLKNSLFAVTIFLQIFIRCILNR
jgi:hypothetical protein